VPDIFDEVSEDLRAEKARALLRRYGAVFVGLLVLSLIGVGIYDYEQTQTGQIASVVADRFIAAQDSATKLADNPGKPPPAELVQTFADIAAHGTPGYKVLANLELAALDWDAGRHDAAIAAWQAISDDPKAPQLLRDLATLVSAQHQVDTGDAQAVKKRLAPLVTGTTRFRPLAEQVTALLDIRLGRKTEAAEIMKTLAIDPQAPPGVRQMAQDLLITLGDDRLGGEDGARPHG
jgi:hypothetical protein